MEKAISDQIGVESVKILRGNVIDSTNFGKLFLKYGEEDLVVGEFESLKAIEATHTISCPKPFGVVRTNETSALVTSFIDFRHGKNWSKMGELLGRMHIKNRETLESDEKNEKFVGKRVSECSENSEFSEEEPEGSCSIFPTTRFGFPVPTCCGRIAQENEWTDSWSDFFIRHRLRPQIDRITENGDRSLLDVADALYRTAAQLLRNRAGCRPSLVHGDLWGGNWSMQQRQPTEKSPEIEPEPEPVIFDPAASFSDPEFEFGIMSMFGGWTRDFEIEYQKIVGGAWGSKEKEHRIALYELYHHLNHWNHFNGSYKASSMALIKKIIKIENI